MMTPPASRKRKLVQKFLNKIKKKTVFKTKARTYPRPTYKKYSNNKKTLSGNKMRKTKIDKMEKNGIALKIESMGQVFSQETAAPTYAKSQSIILGHTSVAPITAINTVAYALIKRLATKMGYNIHGFSQIIEGMTVGDAFVLSHQLNQASAAVTFTNLFVLVPGTTTWNDVADALATAFQQTANLAIEYVELVFEPVAASRNAYYKLNLINCNVHTVVSSQLKVQNVSVPAAGDDTVDEIDAVYLQGKTFTGRGLGTELIKPRSIFSVDVGLHGNKTTGFITRRYALDAQPIRDIPRAEELLNCSKSGTVTFGPGAIQQANLYYKDRGNLNAFIKKYRDCIYDITTAQSEKVGSFALHFLEKVIEGNAAASPIVAEYQLEYLYKTMITEYKPAVTTQVVVLNGATIQ